MESIVQHALSICGGFVGFLYECTVCVCGCVCLGVGGAHIGVCM